MESTGRNLLTSFSKLRLALSRFSRNTRILDTLLVQDWSTEFIEFHENRSNGLVSDTDLLTDRLTD